MPAKKRKKLSVTRVLGILLIILGLAVIGYIPYTYVRGVMTQRNLRGQFTEESAAALALNQTVLDKLQGAEDLDKLKELAEEYKKRLTSEQIVGQLEIPKIGKNLIVVEGTGDNSLKKGPGHMEETPLPGANGNFAVAGDRVLYGAPFLSLNDMSAGDQVIMRTQYAQLTYTVTGKRVTDPEDTSVLNPVGYEAITLITCDPPWSTSHRLIVSGKMTGYEFINKPATTTTTPLPPA
jgi:sortase A